MAEEDEEKGIDGATEGRRVRSKRVKEDRKSRSRNVGKYGVAMATEGNTRGQPENPSSSEQQPGRETRTDREEVSLVVRTIQE